MSKQWKHYPESCEKCGGDSEVYTNKETTEGYVYDADPIRCTECPAIGHMTVEDEDCVYANWYN